MRHPRAEEIRHAEGMDTSPADWVRLRNGVAHSSALRAAGFSEHSVRRAVAEGSLLRVRRSWLVTPECDPRRVAAASVSGRLTCVSAAAAMGLWVIESDAVHIAIPQTTSRVEAPGVTLHRATAPVPVPTRSAEDPLINVLFHVARCQPPDAALSIWESAVRQEMVDLEVLARVRWRCAPASDLARLVGARSDSGKESRFVALMREVGVTVQQQAWVDGHPLDGLIGRFLGVQIDGFVHHSRAADRRRDITADARLALRGYTMLRFDAHQVDHQGGYVQQTVLTAMAQGLHLRRA